MPYTKDELRKVQGFIPYNLWPNEINTNCIAYALGLPLDDPRKETFSNLLGDNPIESLEEILKFFGFNPVRVESVSDIPKGSYGFVLYHYTYKEEKSFFGCSWTEDTSETHLVRIEPDGIWTHKFGWGYNTSTTTPEEIHDVILNDDKVDVSPIAFFHI